MTFTDMTNNNKSEGQLQEGMIGDIVGDKRCRKAEKRRKQKTQRKEKRKEEKAASEAEEVQRKIFENHEEHKRRKQLRYLDLQTQARREFHRERILYEFKRLKDPRAIVQPKSLRKHRRRGLRRVLRSESRKKEVTPTPPSVFFIH